MKIYGFADAASDDDKDTDGQPSPHKWQRLLRHPSKIC